MHAVIQAAFSRTSTVVLVLLLLLGAGVTAYLRIAKEASPSIPIPSVFVSTGLPGIAPEDAERQLALPLEAQLTALAGLRRMATSVAEGTVSIDLEFEPGADATLALDAVRRAVERARPMLPERATAPVVEEVNTSLFPVITVMIYGPVPERTLVDLAQRAERSLEAVPGVLDVTIGGDRREVLEVLIEPGTLETYQLPFEQLSSTIQRNNQLIAAGAIETGAGRLALKVPGLIETVDEVASLPVKAESGTVVRFEDLATARRTFEAPTSFARINGEPALALEVKKRSGANIIETVAGVRALMEELTADWPASVRVEYLQDESVQVRTLLTDLQNNVVAAIVLVMLVILGALGPRSALLVGLSIPGAFLTGVAILWAMGVTLNIVVLFSLILVVGMLVDGAIVTVELAERRLMAGASPREAYAEAATR
ncbi:MAG: efflux RND transporter permease subunit, partial [Pseudomonadota bacterium]